MATGKQWEEYFEKKSESYLVSQAAAITSALNKLDKKIISDFQLSYLSMVKHIIMKILRDKYKHTSYGGVF